MDEETIKRIVTETVAEIGHQHQVSCEFCVTDERRKAHRLEHEFIQQLMRVSERWDNVRWELLRDVLKWAGRIVVTAMILGIVIMASKTAGMKMP